MKRILLCFALLGLALVLHFGSRPASAVRCSLDPSKDCLPRRECVINCQQCSEKDQCCCKHVDKCECIEPETGRPCCEELVKQ